MHGFVSKKNTYGDQHKNGKPHTEKHRSDIFFCKFFSKNIEQMKDDEKDDGCYQWHTQTAFPDN